MFRRRRPLLRAAVVGGGAPEGAQQAGQADTPISEQLKQLTTLHENGSLDDAEFSAAKRKLLGI